MALLGTVLKLTIKMHKSLEIRSKLHSLCPMSKQFLHCNFCTAIPGTRFKKGPGIQFHYNRHHLHE